MSADELAAALAWLRCCDRDLQAARRCAANACDGLAGARHPGPRRVTVVYLLPGE